MCEFCPRYGRCIVCDHLTVHLPPPASPPRSASDSEGYPVTMDGVTVRFSDHRDAMTVLNTLPRSLPC
jgi:hypothetical protein